MEEFNVVPSVHTEVIRSMSSTEKNELINELSFLLQNNAARINVLKEGGFRQLFRVLTGKDKQIRDQISLDTNSSIKIVLDILVALSRENDSLREKQLHLQNELIDIKRSDDLQSMYLLRILSDMETSGISTADVEPLLEDWKAKREKLELAAAEEEAAAMIETEAPAAELPYDELPEGAEFPESADPDAPAVDRTELRKDVVDKYIGELGGKAYNSSDVASAAARTDAVMALFRGKITGTVIGLLDLAPGRDNFEGILFTGDGFAYKKSMSKFFIRYDEIESIAPGMNLFINGHFRNGMDSLVISSSAGIPLAALKTMLEELRSV